MLPEGYTNFLLLVMGFFFAIHDLFNLGLGSLLVRSRAIELSTLEVSVM